MLADEAAARAAKRGTEEAHSPAPGNWYYAAVLANQCQGCIPPKKLEVLPMTHRADIAHPTGFQRIVDLAVDFF